MVQRLKTFLLYYCHCGWGSAVCYGIIYLSSFAFGDTGHWAWATVGSLLGYPVSFWFQAKYVARVDPRELSFNQIWRLAAFACILTAVFDACIVVIDDFDLRGNGSWFWLAPVLAGGVTALMSHDGILAILAKKTPVVPQA